MNAFTKKIDLDEVETWTWEIVESAVQTDQSEEIAELLENGEKAKGRLQIANHQIFSLENRLLAKSNKIIELEAKLKQLIGTLEIWQNETADKATELELNRILSKLA